ncbi:F-box protein [Quillaja saponaria]|uniref:F-box protein n=1 Tax=Quillaja saponaria TaxID=32244 RepID=A0AAD7LPG1_QUISA|nr:F-box protein [Quillaja saponaria]
MLSRDLSEDLVIEILLRLPVKSLIRFKCIRKSWYDLIKSPYFISIHLNHAKLNKNPNLLLQRQHVDTIKPYFSLLSYETLEVLTDSLDIPFGPVRSSSGFFAYPCNGIICLYWFESKPRHGDALALWNPATGESKAIPIFHRPPNVYVDSFYLGFGLDLKSNDYKVVRISTFICDSDHDDHFNFCNYTTMPRKTQVEVYTLSTDSWRVINTTLPAYPRCHPKSLVYLKGVTMWKASDDDGSPLGWGENDRVILSFDLSDEVFQKSPLPPKSGIAYDECVLVINDSIAFVELFGNIGYEWIDIWEMNDSDVERTWTKKLRITVHNGSRSLFLGPWGNGKFFLDTGLDELLIYDADRQAFMNTGIYGTLHSLQIVTYTESLVSFRREIEFEQHHDIV